MNNNKGKNNMFTLENDEKVESFQEVMQAIFDDCEYTEEDHDY